MGTILFTRALSVDAQGRQAGMPSRWPTDGTPAQVARKCNQMPTEPERDPTFSSTRASGRLSQCLTLTFRQSLVWKRSDTHITNITSMSNSLVF